MPSVQHKRGVRADLDARATANQLLEGELYLLTDEQRLAIATSVSAYIAAAKESERLQSYVENFGDGTATSYVITHGLGTRDVIVQVRQVASPYAQRIVDVEHTSTTQVTLKFDAAVATDELRVMVLAPHVA